ncbi:MAG: hypothetical protein WAM70_18045 [Pyrinomonadaceae bacterium]
MTGSVSRVKERVLRDGSLVHAYRNRAQTRVQQKYDWEYVVDRYEELFARMAGQSPPERQSTQTDSEHTEQRAFSRSASA